MRYYVKFKTGLLLGLVFMLFLMGNVYAAESDGFQLDAALSSEMSEDLTNNMFQDPEVNVLIEEEQTAAEPYSEPDPDNEQDTCTEQTTGNEEFELLSDQYTDIIQDEIMIQDSDPEMGAEMEPSTESEQSTDLEQFVEMEQNTDLEQIADSEQITEICEESEDIIEFAIEKIPDGFQQKDGIWAIYKNNQIQTEQKGLIEGNMNGAKGWYYVENGVFAPKTGLARKTDHSIDNHWYYVENGKYKKEYTGFSGRADGINDNIFYVENGIWTKVQGMVYGTINGYDNWYYFEKGTFTKASGVTRKADHSIDSNWYYVRNGIYTISTGLSKRADRLNEKYFYVKDGQWNKATGLIYGKINGKNNWYYFQKGTFTKATGLTQKADHSADQNWYYVNNGVYNKNFSGNAARITGDTVSLYSVENGVSVEKILNVLLIGNSLIYTNATLSCPSMIRELAALHHRKLSITYLKYPGVSLADYATGSYYYTLVSKLKSKKYDVIVLQEESWTACGKSATYFNNISNIMKVIQANGQQNAKIVLDAINGCSHIQGTNQVDFEKNTLVNVTLAAEWIKKTYPEKTVLVSKPGELFLQSQIAYPNGSYMQSDGNHPTYTGFYLTSMRLYSSIFNSPIQYAPSGMQKYTVLANRTMTINHSAARIKIGKTLQLTVSNAGGKVTWKSYNTNKVQVSANGLVKAIGKGSTIVLAQSSSGLQATCYVTGY